MLMILIVHIILAISSVVVATLSVGFPSITKVRASTGLAIGTLASGTLLVFSSNSHLVEACLSGIVYLAIVSYLIATAHSKLASYKIKQ